MQSKKMKPTSSQQRNVNKKPEGKEVRSDEKLVEIITTPNDMLDNITSNKQLKQPMKLAQKSSSIPVKLEQKSNGVKSEFTARSLHEVKPAREPNLRDLFRTLCEKQKQKPKTSQNCQGSVKNKEIRSSIVKKENCIKESRLSAENKHKAQAQKKSPKQVRQEGRACIIEDGKAAREEKDEKDEVEAKA